MYRIFVKRKKRDKNKKRIVVKAKPREENKREKRTFVIGADGLPVETKSKYEIEYKRRKASQNCEEFIEETKFRLNFLSEKYGKRFHLISAQYNNDDSGICEHVLTYEILPHSYFEDNGNVSNIEYKIRDIASKLNKVEEDIDRVETRMYNKEYDTDREMDSIRSSISELSW